MSPDVRKLVLLTTTRADWSILCPLARALKSRADVELTVAAANMHLLDAYGHTVDEIRADGFDDIRLIRPDETAGDTAEGRIAITAGIAGGLGALFSEKEYDGLIVLGDRYELLGAATAALLAGVPIVHLHGGEISEGAVDDSVRHAVSKMATLHLVATERSAMRLRQMGEEPERIVVTGAIGVENALTLPPMDRKELEDSLDGFALDSDRTLLVTYHPVTRHPASMTPEQQVDSLVGALRRVKDCNMIITFPNNDAGSEVILGRLREFADGEPDRVRLVRSLGRRRYLSALRYVKAVVGNSSSGLLEAPSTPAFTVDIGPRQQGRERSDAVIHCEDDPISIESAIRRVLALGRRSFSPGDNPYYRPDSVATATDAIVTLLPRLPKIKKFATPFAK